MRLSTYITTHLDEILSEWVSFARTRGPAGRDMDFGMLRDHASEMLTAIAKDLETPRSEREAEADSKGFDDAAAPSVEPPAQAHGAGRAAYGFTLPEMVSEFRAVRAAVLRGWLVDLGEITTESLREVIRFDGAISQTLTASVSRYIQEQDHAREIFLGVLGHDLKSPLGTVITASRFLIDEQRLEEPVRSMIERIDRSAQRMNRLVDDLLDFTRIRLGSGIPIAGKPTNIEKLVRETVDETKTANPDKSLLVRVTAPVQAVADSERIQQAISNLISNAIQHGDASAPVDVSVSGDEQEVSIAVHNQGKPIPPDQLGQIFNPFVQAAKDSTKTKDPSHLGLGLYIANSIVRAHGGRIDVDSSSDRGTTFTIRIPKHSSEAIPDNTK